MTKLEEGSVLKREIKVAGVDAPVNVTLTYDGIRFAVRGTKKSLLIGWAQVIRSCPTPMDIPAHFAGRPFDFLVAQAAKKNRAAKNRDG